MDMMVADVTVPGTAPVIPATRHGLSTGSAW